MWVPAPLYEALPCLYIFIGTAALFLTDEAFGWFLGAILIVAGALSWITRRANREPIIGSTLT